MRTRRLLQVGSDSHQSTLAKSLTAFGTEHQFASTITIWLWRWPLTKHRLFGGAAHVGFGNGWSTILEKEGDEKGNSTTSILFWGPRNGFIRVNRDHPGQSDDLLRREVWRRESERPMGKIWILDFWLSQKSISFSCLAVLPNLLLQKSKINRDFTSGESRKSSPTHLFLI